MTCLLCQRSGETEQTGAISSKDNVAAHQNCLVNTPPQSGTNLRFQDRIESSGERERNVQNYVCFICIPDSAFIRLTAVCFRPLLRQYSRI